MFDRQGGRKYLNEVERSAFFQAVQSEEDHSQRAFCLTLFYCGCRISEALNLATVGIDVMEKAVVLETLKRRQRGLFRSVPIPASLVALFQELCIGKMPSERVWPFSRPTAFRLVKKHMVSAGIEGAMACPKGLRHGFAVACIGKNIPLPTVQKWLGHARLETTAIYLGVSGEEERELAKRLWKKEEM